MLRTLKSLCRKKIRRSFFSKGPTSPITIKKAANRFLGRKKIGNIIKKNADIASDDQGKNKNIETKIIPCQQQ